MQPKPSLWKPHGVCTRHGAWSSPIEAVALGIVVGIVYWLAARQSLILLTQTDGVAVFWPAAGLASGALIALGPKARWPVAAGVIAATVAANLQGDRNLASAIVFAFCNAGEALFAAWLISRRYGADFTLATIPQVLAFLAAIAVAAVISGAVATAGFILFHNLGAPVLTIWLNWSAADALGAVAVAPLIIGLAHLIDDVPEMVESLEGMAALVVLAAVSIVTLSTSSDYWLNIAPLGMILPLLFWLAARGRPLFAAMGVFILALVIVWTTTFGVGRLGDPSIPLLDRVQAARAALLLVTLCGLILAALFAERRQKDAALRDSNERLQLAVEGAELGIWSLDLISGRFENNARDRHIHGHDLEAPPQTLAAARSFINSEDLARIDAGFRASGRVRSNYQIDQRVAPASGSTPASERWVALEGTVVRDAEGRPVRLLGVTRDITERKQLEESLAVNERKLRELLEALPAAIYVTDAEGYVTYCNQAAVNLWGTTPRFGEDRWYDLARFYDRHGVPMPLGDCPTEIALRQGRSVRNVEAILERLDGARVPIVPYPTPLYDKAGAVAGVINMSLDISERKTAELALAERTMQLDLAGKVALVGTFTLDVATGRMQVSPGYAAIHGLPEGTEDSRRAAWRARVHPDDLARLETRLERTVVARQHDHHCDYRIVRPGGEVRWIESRSFISYDGDGPRLVGANIDVTDRKSAERALKERSMQLSLAGKAARVGSFAYDADTEMMQISEGYAAIHGLPEGSVELARSKCLATVHPDDIGQVRQLRSQAFDAGRREYSVEYRIIPAGGEVRWVETRCFITYDGAGRPLRVVGVGIDITERKRVEDQQRKLIAELDHRVKNVLATVVAVVANARETSSSMQHFVEAVDARIRALAFTHELLSIRRWQGLPLAALLRFQLTPYAVHNNTHIDGPDVLLAPEAGQAVGMVLHELATNAAKYGALSVRTGQVTVQWAWSQNQGAGEGLVIKWQEAGAPAVKAPGKLGYGTSVINELVPYELGGKTNYEFFRTGVACRIEIPATWAIRSYELSPDVHGAGSAPSSGHEVALTGGPHG